MTSTLDKTQQIPIVEEPAPRSVAPPPGPPRKPRQPRWYPARAKRPPMVPLDPWRRSVALIALTVCGTLCWALLYILVLSGSEQARSQHKLYATMRGELALATAPTGGLIRPGTGVAVLTIPKAGLFDEVVVEGTTSGVTRAGPGHLRTSPLPGQVGVSVIMGRAQAFGAPFANLRALHPGDKIGVTTDQGNFVFAVIDQRREGDPIPDPLPDGKSRLTLATSTGGLTPNHALYVDADLQGTPAIDPGGRPNTLSPSENLLAGEGDTLIYCELFLWLQLLVVLSIAIPWLRHKWGLWQVWLVGTPALIAVVWSASSTAVRLLPNVL